jgi:hypothetical protein
VIEEPRDATEDAAAVLADLPRERKSARSVVVFGPGSYQVEKENPHLAGEEAVGTDTADEGRVFNS